MSVWRPICSVPLRAVRADISPSPLQFARPPELDQATADGFSQIAPVVNRYLNLRQRGGGKIFVATRQPPKQLGNSRIVSHHQYPLELVWKTACRLNVGLRPGKVQISNFMDRFRMSAGFGNHLGGAAGPQCGRAYNQIRVEVLALD